jgi:protein-tyrosine kinase
MSRWFWGVVLLGLIAVCGLALAPRGYVATGGVLLPSGESLVAAGSEVSLDANTGSRMIRVQYGSTDPQHAVSVVNDFLRRQKDALLLDEARVTRAGFGLLQYLALAGAVGGLGLGILLLWRRSRRAARSETDLNAVLGVPMLAARPLATQQLCAQLLAHWFRGGRTVLAVVSPEDGAGTPVAAALARAFAQMGEPTLLIDADLRAPRMHREFGLRNRRGLADFLDGREARLARCADNLAVMVAGRSGADPLDLLSRGRLPHLLAAAAKRYRVVLVDTPAAAQGPDLQMFAAFGGGALVVARFSTKVPALERLRDLLAGCRARVVGTVLNPA